MGMGVVVAAALTLRSSAQQWLGVIDVLAIANAFRGAFVCIGIITVMSAWVFWQLESDRVKASPGNEAARKMMGPDGHDH